jgi:hypothetical protein
MTDKYMSEHEVEAFQTVAANVAKAHALLSDSTFLLSMTRSADAGPTDRALDLLMNIQLQLAGLSYDLTPQPEWQGGDQGSKYRWPHGVAKPR